MKPTKMSRAVMESMMNGEGTMFGGALFSWMDEIAGITAKRFAGKTVTTAAVEHVNFYHPIYAGVFLDVVGEVISVGNTSMKVQVSVLQDEGQYGEQELLVADGLFVFVALDENKQPTPIERKPESPGIRTVAIKELRRCAERLTGEEQT